MYYIRNILRLSLMATCILDILISKCKKRNEFDLDPFNAILVVSVLPITTSFVRN